MLALILCPSTQRVEIRIGVLAIFCCMYVEDERFEKWPELLMSNGRDRELYIYYIPLPQWQIKRSWLVKWQNLSKCFKLLSFSQGQKSKRRRTHCVWMVVQISEFLLRLLLAERIINNYNSQYFSIAFDKCKSTFFVNLVERTYVLLLRLKINSCTYDGKNTLLEDCGMLHYLIYWIRE